MTTFYVVQSYQTVGLRIQPDKAEPAPTMDRAIERAKQLASKRFSVAAYSINVDEEIGFVGDPRELWRHGQIPSA